MKCHPLQLNLLKIQFTRKISVPIDNKSGEQAQEMEIGG